MTATRAAICLFAAAAMLATAPTERPCRAQTTRPAGETKRIRVGSCWTSLQDELASAAKAYEKKHPDVRVVCSDDYLNVPGRLLNGEIDLANYRSSLLSQAAGPDYAKFEKGIPETLIERTVGYWPLAVVVHPANPMTSITMDQIRRLMTDPNARWQDIGRPTDWRIHLHLYHCSDVTRALAEYDFATGGVRNVFRVPRDLELTVSRAWNRHRAGVSLQAAIVPDLTNDPNAIAIWYHGKKLAASGYKILPIVAGPDRRAHAPTDTAAVARGAYPLRTPLKVAIRASAPDHVKAFVDWLSSPEAAAAFKSGADDERSWYWPAAHVSEASAADSSPAAATRPAPTEAPVAAFTDPIAGAVAVLPTEKLSLLFRMADRSHLAACEQAVAEAIESDGRLKMVDRTQLARVLNERRLQILGLQDAPSRAIISADVLVVSHLVTENLQTFLRIRAFHGPTGGLLGELRLPVNPANPAAFDPPLAHTVGRWWPDVLRRLRDSREEPAWVLLDVYPASVDQLDPAETMRKSLQESLAANPSIFVSGDAALDNAQQEMLLRILGLASPAGGRFTPAADYLIDARLLESGTLELRLRNAAMKVLAEKTISGPADALVSAAREWLRQQIAARPHRQAAATMPAGTLDEWARHQALVEMEIAHQLHARAGWRYDAVRRRWDVPARTPTNPEESAALRAAGFRHALRAAQLDPTNEDAAYQALHAPLTLRESAAAGSENAMTLATYLAPLERFLQAFPRSKHTEEVLYLHSRACMWKGDAEAFPAGDEGALRLAQFRRGLESYARSMELYRIKGKPDPEYQAIMCFDHYLYHLRTYIAVADRSEKELESIVAEWSRRFDGHPGKAVHSDFVRLIVLMHKKDRPGFIECLTKMQQRWPDPKHPQWARTVGMVNEMISRLFSGVDSSNSSFHLWYRGLRGIGDIPKVGYKPESDNPHYRSVISFACPQRGEALEAVLAVGREYRKLQPGVEIFNWAGSPGKKTTYIEVAESRYTSVVVGPFAQADRKALEELYRGGLPLRRVGYLSGKDDPAAREVLLLPPPGAGKAEVLDDFLRFLKTPEGAKALAEHGVYPSADQPASQPATQPARTHAPLDKPPGE